MSYRAGIGESMEAIGWPPRQPHIVCDGCGATHGVGTRDSYAANWFLARKPPPGWRGLRMVNGEKRWDLCPKCWKAPAETEKS